MSDVVRVVQQIGIDIILTGVFVIAVFFVGWHIAREKTCRAGLRSAKDRLLLMLRRPDDGKDATNDAGRSPINLVAGIALLALAAMTGRLFTLVGDEILDSNILDSWVFLYVPNFDKWGEQDKKWENEDELKQKTLDDAFEWTASDARTREILAPYVYQKVEFEVLLAASKGGGAAASACAYESRDDCARAFFQHAQAGIRQRGSDETRAMLSRETSIAEFLSVVFVSIWGLLLAALFGPAWKSAMDFVRDQSGQAAASLTANAAFILSLWIAEGVALRLWTEQTKLLDRKIIYSYIATVEDTVAKQPAETGNQLNRPVM